MDVRNDVGGFVHGAVVQAGSIGAVHVGAPSVPVRAAVRDPAKVFHDVLSDGFTGRAWLEREVDAFLAGPCGYLWVEAEAGLGKTAFAAHLVRERGWLSHFARYANGGAVRVGLQNLAGQLVRRFDLADLVPGDALPEWAHTPEGFEALLGAAAERGPVVLVVDGADEAERPGLPWGLPRTLPPGVHVVGTYRTGMARPACDSPSRVVRIEADDPRNRADLTAHLASVVDDPDLARALADRCGGVWIYLRYLLHELRLGTRRPDDLTSLPSNLRAYYTGQLTRWSRSPDWRTGLLPLLATLNAAAEPLDVDTLARLTGADVRQWCQYELRPFLTATEESPRKYAIYHASFRELLDGVVPADGGDDERAWADTLAAATRAAHGRIADHCSAHVDDYALRHLAGHLVRAGRVADLHRLLVAEEDGLNTWFAAHDRADGLDSYLADLAPARGEARREVDAAVAGGRPAPALADVVRYQLMASSVTGRIARLSPKLIAALVEYEVWTPERALTHVRHLPTNHIPVALRLLLPHLPTRLLDAALEVAEAIDAPAHRVRARQDIAAHLPAERRSALLARSSDLAAARPDAAGRADALHGIAGHPSPEGEPAVPDLVGGTPDEHRRADVVVDLARRTRITTDQLVEIAEGMTSPEARAQVLNAAIDPAAEPSRSRLVRLAWQAVQAIGNPTTRAVQLLALSRELPADLLAEGVEFAAAAGNPYLRAYLLVRLCSTDSAGRHPELPVRAFDAVLSSARRGGSAELVVDLLPHFPAERRPELLVRAVNATTALRGEAQARALVRLALAMPAPSRDPALSAALAAVDSLDDELVLLRTRIWLSRRIPTADKAPWVAKALADHAFAAVHVVDDLNPDQVEAALRSALADPDDYRGLGTAAALLRRIPEDRRGPLVAAVLDRTLGFNERRRWRVLAVLVPVLSEDQRLVVAELVGRAPRSSESIRVLVGLGRHDPALADLAVAAATTADRPLPEALLDVATVATPAGLAKVAESAKRIEDDCARAWVLLTLADRFTDTEQRELLALGLAAAGDFASGHRATSSKVSFSPDDLSEMTPPPHYGYHDPVLGLVSKAAETPEARDLFLPLLDAASRTVGRDHFTYLLGVTAPTLRRIGGPEALVRISKAIEDTLRWWP
ncbi:P-loop NTPase family protein [Saccharothrix syringae]|uniref:Uncharacterized protein n=1 Tax=Saccharothrix syringae TaxID=103733 RepID=A0A5Q0GXN8_SACSY|nr:hypothetical protein [Saccharothrix syringae]QFZ18122.1 hypothetical protein EKG83_12090 [Saccharothrix syringae]